MKIKALDSFAGAICMACGEVRDVDDAVAGRLIKHGLAELVEQDKPVKKAAKEK